MQRPACCLPYALYQCQLGIHAKRLYMSCTVPVRVHALNCYMTCTNASQSPDIAGSHSSKCCTKSLAPVWRRDHGLMGACLLLLTRARPQQPWRDGECDHVAYGSQRFIFDLLNMSGIHAVVLGQTMWADVKINWTAIAMCLEPGNAGKL